MFVQLQVRLNRLGVCLSHGRRVVLLKLLGGHFAGKVVKSILPIHIPHRYSKEIAKRSTIVSLPILDANEAKHEDCVRILRSYEK